jgi:hypothetical protein
MRFSGFPLSIHETTNYMEIKCGKWASGLSNLQPLAEGNDGQSEVNQKAIKIGQPRGRMTFFLPSSATTLNYVVLCSEIRFKASPSVSV